MNLGDLNAVVSAPELEDILYEAQVMAQEALYSDTSDQKYADFLAYFKKVGVIREYIRAQIRTGGEA